MSINHALATYGTLAPGRPNHHQLSDLRGEWSIGTVRGKLVDKGWGAALGYPALILDADGDKIDVHLFRSADLPGHWSRLDDFEGSEYRRVPAQVETEDRLVDAWIYVNADSGGQ
ncbi:MAG TPA: gamma-glutamylcyclotransferase [Roseiarcus sp.]|jgi:gamma-glutamylcyclotransferase (GGCT)/AIG2-like uncharacterized protein YtfP